jgi:beta-lactamase class A
MRVLLLTALLALGLAAVPAGAEVDPAVVQGRYDAARDREEALLRARPVDRREIARVRAAILAAERFDHRPRGWLVGRELPRTSLPRGSMRARAAAGVDVALERQLAAMGRGYGGWAAFWVHDLVSGRVAGWNSDARFPAASTVKLAVLTAALRAIAVAPERSPHWYDVRQLSGWSSNLAANRLHAWLGSAQVASALRGLGMWSSTYPGPYRAGTARLDAPKPPPTRTWRYTTARDLGRALYALQAAAAGNRYQQRLTGLRRSRARLAIELLLSSWKSGDNAGLVQPFVGRAPVAQKNGWIDEARLTAAIVYAQSGPKIVVVLVYRPNLPYREAQSLGSRVVSFAGLS